MELTAHRAQMEQVELMEHLAQTGLAVVQEPMEHLAQMELAALDFLQ